MKIFIRKNKFILIGALAGFLSGFLYWNFVGCSTGTCDITSIWYNISIYGAIMGALLGSMIKKEV